MHPLSTVYPVYIKEETSYYFPPKTIIRSFIAAASAAMVLKSLNPFNNGKIVLFQVTHTLDYSNPELAGFIALGIFGGISHIILTVLHCATKNQSLDRRVWRNVLQGQSSLGVQSQSEDLAGKETDHRSCFDYLDYCCCFGFQSFHPHRRY